LALVDNENQTDYHKLFYMNTAYNYTGTFSEILKNYKSCESNQDINKRFEIHSLEWMETQESSWNGEAEKLNRFEVIWIKKGRGRLWVDENNYQVDDSIIYCLAPGHVRKWNAETNIEGYYISFAPEFVWLSEGYSNNLSWLEQYNHEFTPAAMKVQVDLQQELDVIAGKMKWEFSNYFNSRLELLKGLLNIFMIYFSRNLKEPKPDVVQTKEGELARKFMNLLKKNFINQKMVSDYAGQLCVTPNYLNRTIKKITGFTASHHIQQQIILEAKRKAMYSSVSMKEIAYYLGFDNLAHFSKFFKNNSGMSFTDYKKMALRPD